MQLDNGAVQMENAEGQNVFLDTYNKNHYVSNTGIEEINQFIFVRRKN
jgi:hypothetical protein